MQRYSMIIGKVTSPSLTFTHPIVAHTFLTSDWRNQSLTETWMMVGKTSLPSSHPSLALRFPTPKLPPADSRTEVGHRKMGPLKPGGCSSLRLSQEGFTNLRRAKASLSSTCCNSTHSRSHPRFLVQGRMFAPRVLWLGSPAAWYTEPRIPRPHPKLLKWVSKGHILSCPKFFP